MRKHLISVLLAVLVTGCGDSVESLGGPTMGSQYSLKYVASAGAAEPAQVQAEVQRVLMEIDTQMSTWRADSSVSAFNQLPAGSCQAMPAPVLELVRYGETLSVASNGAFDLTLAPLADLWGFGAQSRGRQLPSAAQLASARAVVGHQHLRIIEGTLCKDIAAQLDLASIVAGYAVDRIATRLGELGVHSYLLDVTGEIKAAGRKPDGSAWRVAIEAPRDDQQVVQQVIALDGLGMSTSGDYRNYFEKDGKRYSHTLDPQTGAPVSHELASVTVIEAFALHADGLSTLLMVLGPDRGFAYAEHAGVAALFIRRTERGFVSRETSAFTRLAVNAAE